MSVEVDTLELEVFEVSPPNSFRGRILESNALLLNISTKERTQCANAKSNSSKR